jgi:hypothetical protein
MAAPAFIEELQLVGWPATTRSVVGRAGLVTTTTSPIAAYAGINALRAGGTAADAAATVALTQATTALGSYVSHAGIVQALYYEACVLGQDPGAQCRLEYLSPRDRPPKHSGLRSVNRRRGFRTSVCGRRAWTQDPRPRFHGGNRSPSTTGSTKAWILQVSC